MPRFVLLPRLRAAVIGLAFLAVPALAAAQSGPVGAPEGRWRAQVHRVPFDAAASTLLATRVCRPRGEARAPLLIINHGSPPDAAARPRMTLPNCGGTAQWFVERGFVVAMPLRRGYGETGGTWAENYGSCNGADYAAGGLASADDIAAVVRYMRTLPFVAPDRLVVVGQSAGGWASLAYASRYPDGLVAVLNFAGGRGGHRGNVPNSNCSPDRLVAGAGTYGRTARVPMLWVYAENDTFFGPELVRRMHAAFTGAGGRAQLVQPGPFSDDGHRLFTPAGMPIWTPIAGAFLDSVR
jgi:dienelactone hydrolase